MEELIKKAKAGDKKAFTELIKMIENDLYRIARTRLSDDYDIKDAIQETMINTYKHLNNLKDNTNFKSWIIKILINECNKIYRKKSRKDKLIDKVNFEKSLNNGTDYIGDSISNMDFKILIEKLDYQERLIVTLFYNSKYSCNEISEILTMNTNTVKSKLRRAKEKIKKSYKGGIYNG